MNRTNPALDIHAPPPTPTGIAPDAGRLDEVSVGGVAEAHRLGRGQGVWLRRRCLWWRRTAPAAPTRVQHADARQGNHAQRARCAGR